MRSIRFLAALGLGVVVATCSDTPATSVRTGAGPLPTSHARLAVAPVFTAKANAVAQFAAEHARDFPTLQFDSVRVLIRGTPDTSVIVVDTVLFFDRNSPPKTLELDVKVQNEGQRFNAAMEYKGPGGIVYRGSGVVQSYKPGQTPPEQPTIVVGFVGPGANIARITVAPKTVSLLGSQSAQLSVTAVDGAGASVPAPFISWSSSNATIATVSSNGLVQGQSRRGTTTITAITPTGVSDNGSASVTLPAASITVVSGAGQTGKINTALPNPAVVQVSASDGVGVPNVSVVFSAPAGGSVTPATAVTDANGRASASLRLGSAVGPQGFAATAAGFSTAITVTATAGDPAAIAIVGGNGQTDSIRATLAPLSVKVSDAAGNPVSGATVSWARSTGGGTIGAAATTTNGEGIATNSYTLGNAIGGETVTASAGGQTVAFAFTATGGAPATISAVSGNGQTAKVNAGFTNALVVKVSDSQGNAVKNAAITWSAVNATIAGTTAADASGVASAQVKAGSAPGNATITARLANGVSVAFAATVEPGDATGLVFATQPANGTAGQTLPAVSLTVRDAANNIATTAVTPVTIKLASNPTGATLTGTLTRQPVNGVVTFDDLKIDRAGTGYTFSATGSGLATPTSGAFDVAVGTATQLLLVPSSPTSFTLIAGQVFTLPQVKAADAQGNGVAGVTVHAVLDSGVAPNIATVGAADVVTDASGLATISTSQPTTVGVYKLTVTSAAVPGTSLTVTATVSPAAAQGLYFATGPASGTAGTALTPAVTVQVRDQFGNVVPTALPITLGIASGPGTATITGNTATSVAGVATFGSLALSQSGTYYLNASTPGLAQASFGPVVIGGSATPSSVTLSGAATLTIVAGSSLSSPGNAVVKDASNNPLQGVTVTFTVKSGPTVLTTKTGTTNAVGQVSYSTLTAADLPTTAGTYSIIASVGQLSASAVSLVVNAGAASKLRVTPSNAAPPAGAQIALVVQSTDAFGNTATDNTTRTLNWSVNSGSLSSTGTGGSTTAASTMANGLGSIYLTTAGTPGIHSISVADASSPSFSGTQSVTTTNLGIHISQSNATLPASGTVNASIGAPAVKVTTGSSGSGAAITGVYVRWSITAGGGTIAVPPGTNPVNSAIVQPTDGAGLASLASWTLGATAGTNTLTTTAAGAPETVTQSVTGSAGTATQLVFSAVPSQVVTNGTLGTITVTAKDASGNVVTGASGSVSMSLAGGPGGATLGGTTLVAFSNGVSSFGNLSVNTAGAAYTLTATYGALSAASTAFNVVTPVATALKVSMGANPLLVARNDSGFRTTVKVQVVDQTGGSMALPGTTVTAALLHPTGSPVPTLANATATTDASGVATFSTMKVTGLTQSFALSFTASGLTGDTSSTMSMVAGTATRVDTVTSSTYIQTMGTATTLSTLPQVKVTDISGNPVSGFTPNWSLLTPCSSFSFTGTTSATNASGIATAPAVSFPANTALSCAYYVQVVVNAQNVTNSPLSLMTIIAPPNANVWLAKSLTTSWETATNWSKGSVPGSGTDTVFVPAHPYPDNNGFSIYPTLAAHTNRSVGTLYVESSSAQVNVGSDTLTVNGSFIGGRVTANNNGLLRLLGTGSLFVQGTVPRTAIGNTNCSNGASYTLTSQLRSSDTLTVNCQLNVGANTLDTYNIGLADLQVTGTGGILDMTNASASVVAKNVVFDGANSTGHLTNGTLTFYGNFRQAHTNSVRSFVTSGSHKTIGSGSSAQTITVTDDSTSTFNYLTLNGPSTLATDITALQPMTIGSGGSLSPGTHTLTAKDSLTVTGRLDMLVGAAPSKVVVGGNLKFNGTTAQSLQSGEIDVAGNFAESSTAAGVFAPSAGFLVKFNGIGAQTVTFQNPATSYFDKVEFANTSVSGVSLSSNTQFKGQVDVNANGRLVMGGNFFTFTFGNSAPFRIHQSALLNVNGTLTLGTSACQRHGPSFQPTIGGFSGASVALLQTTNNGGQCTETSLP